MNVVVYSVSKKATLSQGTDCFKLTVKKQSHKMKGVEKGRKEIVLVVALCLLCVFIGTHCGGWWSSHWEADLKQTADAGSAGGSEHTRRTEPGELHQGLHSS